MRRCALLLSLIAALDGTPLRQAEAASDLGRSLAELFEGAGLEPPDGGVGDDAGDALLAAATEHAPGTDTSTSLDLPLLPPPASSVITPFDAADRRLRAWWPPAPPGRRQARLHVLRF